MKTLIGPLSFLALKRYYFFLFLNTMFDFCFYLTVFQRFDELAFSLCRGVFCSFQKTVLFLH